MGAAAGAALPTPVTIAIVTVGAVTAAGALQVAAVVFMPIALAGLLALTLSPIMRATARRGIPAAPVAVVLVCAVALLLVGGLAGLAQPLRDWVEDAPRIAYTLKLRLGDLNQPLEAIGEARREAEKLIGEGGAAGDGAQEVVLREDGIMARTADGLAFSASVVVVSLALTLFFLLDGVALRPVLFAVSPDLPARRRVLRMLTELRTTVSRYLLTITSINAALGVAIGAAMALLGMPDPWVWGLLAAILNFIPYAGAAIGIVLSGVAALLTFDGLTQALAVPLVYLLLTTMEGSFVTPVLVGRRLRLSAVAILLSLVFWGFLWGFAGMLMAVPLLLVGKVAWRHLAAGAGSRSMGEPGTQSRPGALHVRRTTIESNL